MNKIRLITPDNKEYPLALLNFDDLRMELFVSGEILPSDVNAVAVVGSRQASEFGEQEAYAISYELAERGITIISGLAVGTDSAAHEGALDAGGRTIAILGSSLDEIYPKENLELAERISENGAVISPFAPGTKPLGKNFLARNKLIAAMSKVVIIGEGKRRSGTLSTANHAADLGIEVMVLPFEPGEILSGAAEYLVENGARVVESVEEILEFM